MIARTLTAAAALLLTAEPAAAQPSRGERAFQDCLTCHTVGEDTGGTPGPDLKGVFGRRAASGPDYAYSDALRRRGRAGLVWNRRTLDAFLADPERHTPGTTMTGSGVANAADRQALIDYLARVAR
jgi:cytochrome c